MVPVRRTLERLLTGSFNKLQVLYVCTGLNQGIVLVPDSAGLAPFLFVVGASQELSVRSAALRHGDLVELLKRSLLTESRHLELEVGVGYAVLRVGFPGHYIEFFYYI